MSKDRCQDRDFVQLQLFGAPPVPDVGVPPLTSLSSSVRTQPVLRLVIGTNKSPAPRASDRSVNVSVIEDRLIGRTKFF